MGHDEARSTQQNNTQSKSNLDLEISITYPPRPSRHARLAIQPLVSVVTD